MPLSLSPLNIIQKIPTSPISGRIVLQPHIWFTCPINKKAIIKGQVRCTGRGAAGEAYFNIAGLRWYTWDRSTSVVGPYLETPDSLTTANGGQIALFEAQLNAGETVETTQNVGTNAEFEIFGEVQETPV